MSSRTGGCQCGAVRYRIDAAPLGLAICHCTECQKQSASAFGMSLFVPESGFHLESGELKTWSRKGDSGRGLVAAFCPDCGVRIYHDTEHLQGVLNVRAGTLDDTSDLRPDIHVWVQSKQAWVELPDGTLAHETQP